MVLATKYPLTKETHRDVDQLVHSIAENSFLEVVRVGGKVSEVNQWTDATKTIPIRRTFLTYTGGQVSSFIVRQYDSAGSLVETLTSAVNRTGGKVSSVSSVLS